MPEIFYVRQGIHVVAYYVERFEWKTFVYLGVGLTKRGANRNLFRAVE